MKTPDEEPPSTKTVTLFHHGNIKIATSNVKAKTLENDLSILFCKQNLHYILWRHKNYVFYRYLFLKIRVDGTVMKKWYATKITPGPIFAAKTGPSSETLNSK